MKDPYSILGVSPGATDEEVKTAYRNLARRGAKLHISGASPQIYKVMKLAGLERLATLDLCTK